MLKFNKKLFLTMLVIFSIVIANVFSVVVYAKNDKNGNKKDNSNTGYIVITESSELPTSQSIVDTPDGESVSVTIDSSTNNINNSDKKGDVNTLAAASWGIGNFVSYYMTPYSNCIEILVANWGIDPIDSFSGTITIRDHNGIQVATYRIWKTNLGLGTTTIRWYIGKYNTVEEKISFSGAQVEDGVTQSVTMSTVRWNFVGGAYGTIPAYGGHVHHCPANSASPLTTYSGPAIRMLIEDHKLTASYGSSAAAIQYRTIQRNLINQGRFLEAQQMDIDDIRSKFGSKYDAAIAQMVAYTRSLGYTQ